MRTKAKDLKYSHGHGTIAYSAPGTVSHESTTARKAELLSHVTPPENTSEIMIEVFFFFVCYSVFILKTA